MLCHIQVIAATNRADILDPALMRSGRLDRKVEFPHPNEDARAKILQIHSRKMNVGYAPPCWLALTCIPAIPCTPAVLVAGAHGAFDQTLALCSKARCSKCSKARWSKCTRARAPDGSVSKCTHCRRCCSHRPDVNFEELARGTDDFNAAQLKAVCVEAGMLALRRDALEVNHEDFNEGIVQVQAKKKANLGVMYA